MTARTNINIISPDHVFPYYIDYRPNRHERSMESLMWKEVGDDIRFFDYSKNQLVRVQNDWEKLIPFGSTQYVPGSDDSISTYKEAEIDLYFPQWSVDTFERGVLYAFSVNTWIHGKCVWLGSWLLNRLDATAVPEVVRFQDTNYYERMTFKILDPEDLVYADNWADFRQKICGEPESTNAVGSILNFTLYPVEKQEDIYIKKSGYTGGATGMNILETRDGYWGLDLEWKEKGHNNLPEFILRTTMNGVYTDLKEYFQETYNTSISKFRYEMVIRDDENIYAYREHETEDESTVSFAGIKFNFKNWTGWKVGIYVQASINVLDENDNEVFYQFSNKIPLTQEVFKYLVGDPIKGYARDGVGNILDGLVDYPYIDIEATDMNIYNIRAVNKVQNTVVQMENPNDSKSGLIQPVFFQTRNIQDVTIHPAVTENILINLDAYKSKVSTFILQIEGQTFIERGRTGRGVIFAVVGNQLPREVEAGTLYILNENSELVTTGKYKYE